jgi:predicted Zn-dependent protease
MIALLLALQINLVSVEQEIEIGRQANAQVRKEMPELRDPEVVAFVQAIGRRLVRHAGGPKYPYAFGVIDYREINAFALPGGPVWLHRGVLHAAGNESQVAGVLAHEVAHVAQRHAASQLTKAAMAQWGLGLLGAVLGNTAGAGAAQMAAGFLANGVFLKFSRDDEREADRVGLQILRQAGWDGRGMVELFEVLQREQRRDPGSVEVFFSSHPPPRDRIAQLRATIGGTSAGTRDTARFRAVKARVRSLPSPKRMPE